MINPNSVYNSVKNNQEKYFTYPKSENASINIVIGYILYQLERKDLIRFDPCNLGWDVEKLVEDSNLWPDSYFSGHFRD